MAQQKMPDQIRVRAMVIEDYEQVRHLWMTIHGFGIRSIDDTKEEVDRFLKRNPTTSVVAVCGEKVVGAILCGSDGRQGCLYHVCVARKFRRQGIGRRMVGYCMNALRRERINRVTLIAFTKNDVGNAFWRQIGWTCRQDCNYYQFILNEARYSALTRSFPERAETLFAKAEATSVERYKHLLRLKDLINYIRKR